jgi:hypothetical protein
MEDGEGGGAVEVGLPVASPAVPVGRGDDNVS